MRQAFAPMRLSRWQLAKLFAAQIHRDNPVAAKVGVVLFVVGFFWIVTVLTRPRRLDKELGLPLIGGSRTLKNDFAAVVERGRQMVSWTNPLGQSLSMLTVLASTRTNRSSLTHQAALLLYIHLAISMRSSVSVRKMPVHRTSFTMLLMGIIPAWARKLQHYGRRLGSTWLAQDRRL
jgi:hypothetical protein